jgi:hypothetical protein
MRYRIAPAHEDNRHRRFGLRRNLLPSGQCGMQSPDGSRPRATRCAGTRLLNSVPPSRGRFRCVRKQRVMPAEKRDELAPSHVLPSEDPTPYHIIEKAVLYITAFGATRFPQRVSSVIQRGRLQCPLCPKAHNGWTILCTPKRGALGSDGFEARSRGLERRTRFSYLRALSRASPQPKEVRNGDAAN